MIDVAGSAVRGWSFVAAQVVAVLGLASAFPAAAALSDRYELETVPEFGDRATSITVEADRTDGMVGSLRWAIREAALDGTPSVVHLRPGTYSLTSGCVTYAPSPAVRAASQLSLPDDALSDDDNVTGDLDTAESMEPLKLEANGDATIVQTCPDQRVMHHRGAGDLVISGLVIQNGEAVDPFGGGSGGGLFSDGGAEVVVVDSVFRNNLADANGGAVYVSGRDPTVLIRNSSITENRSTSGGGAVAVVGDLELLNTTVADNRGGSVGGVSASELSLKMATISDNVANASTDGRQVSAHRLISFGSVVTGGAGALDACSIDVSESLGWNFSDDNSCGYGPGEGDRVDTTPAQLGVLSVYRGWTFSRPPLVSSYLVDAIPASACRSVTDIDQLGTFRPAGDACDVGAVELAPGMRPRPMPATPAPPAAPRPGVAPYTG